MGKQAISVTLEADNLAWLRGRAHAGTRSVSETLDRLIRVARAGGAGSEARSVVGTISISPADPELLAADAAVNAVFRGSLARPQGDAPARRRPGRAPRRARG